MSYTPEQLKDKYFVYNPRDAKAGYCSGCIVWWKAGGHGYCRDLKHAGLFTLEDAAKGYPDPAHCVYVPAQEAWDTAYHSESQVFVGNLRNSRTLAKEIKQAIAQKGKD